MATNIASRLERIPPDRERVHLLESGASTFGRRVVVERCHYGNTALCSIAFLLLGPVIAALGAATPNINPHASATYIAGGAAELVLGVCLIVRLIVKCSNCGGISTSTGDYTNCFLFATLTLLFLVWCATVCSFCAALVFSGVDYTGDRREVSAIVLTCISLLLQIVFGASVCFWAGCQVD